MILKKEYLKNPCKTLSIPLWKEKNIKLSESVMVVHEHDYEGDVSKANVARFFRMIHHLQEPINEESRQVRPIVLEDDLQDLVKMINLSYAHEHITVSDTKVLAWTKHVVYDPSLWVKIVEDGQIVASGIAEYDPEVKEGILEWIQVKPTHQGKGYGKAMVNALLKKLKSKADFVTVSGHLDNQTDPRKLYQSCGFTGDDVWLVISKK